MRYLGVGLLLLVAAGAAYPGAGADLPGELRTAQDALSANLGLGQSLAGGPATTEQAAEAQKRLDEGLAAARAYARVQARSAAAHHLIGMLLVFGYRPVESKVTTTDSEGMQHEEKLIALRQAGSKAELEEGLAELRSASRLAPKVVEYQIDYAEAFQMSGEARRSTDLLNALWMRKEEMTAAERARAANLLARAARSGNMTQEEARWLREALRNDPGDQAARKRLAELGPVGQGTITWQAFEAGMGQAKQEGRPAMVDFMAEWCSWCKKLDREVYTNPQVLSASQKFVCIKVDGDRRRDLVQRYRVDGYPTILFLDPQGRELHRVVGYEPAEAFLGEMQKAAR
jgi:thioredoxin-like negative regulator of GroEL